MELVALAVVDGDPVAVDLGHAVGAARVERRRLALGDLLHLAEHLRRAGLVEADLGVDEADGVEQAGDAHGRRLARQHRLAEAGLHEGLGGQVVDLGRPVVAQDVDERDLVEEVAGDELDLVLDVGDALEVHRARAPHHADDRVALRQQKFGQVRAVLARDARDQCPFCHRGNASRPGQWALPRTRTVRRGDGVHGLVPARRWRRGRRRGGEMGRCAGPPRLGRCAPSRARGPVDTVLPGLAMDAAEPPTRAEVDDALADADLVIVENLCSLPLNPASGGRGGARPAPGARRSCTITTCRGSARTWPHLPPPPDDPAWAHVTINELSRVRAGDPRDRGDDDLQRVRSRSGAGRRAGVRAALGCPRRDAAAAPADAGAGPQEHRRSHRPGRGGRRHLLAARPRRGRVRARARAPGRRGPAAASCSARPRRLLHRRRVRGVRRRRCCPRSGRVSATPRWSRRRTGGRWPSARTRSRPSWRPSASTGSTRPTRPRWRAGCDEPDEALLAHNHQVAARALQPGRPAGPAVGGAASAFPVSDRSVT